MSPEQASAGASSTAAATSTPGLRALRDAGGRAAVHRPHGAGDHRQARHADPVPSLRTVRVDRPPAAGPRHHQALAKVPADRFPTIALFARALNETPATEAVAVAPSTMSVKRSAADGFWARPRLVALGLVAMLGLSAVTALFWRLGRRRGRSRPTC